MKKAVTMVEIMVAVIVVGIVVAISLPLFPKALESTKAKYAVVALQQIRTGERIYRLDTGFYYPSAGTVDDEDSINAALKIYLDTRESDWRYEIDSQGVADEFKATAERTGGSAVYKDKTIVIDETGQYQGEGTWPLPLPGQ